MDYEMKEVDGPDEDYQSSFTPKESAHVIVPIKLVPKRQELPIRKVSGFMDLFNSEQRLTFLVKGMLPHTGLLYMGGISGTGKTIIAIQFAINIVLGRNTMTWEIGDVPDGGIRLLILSLEMSEPELYQRLHQMYPDLSEEDQKILQENVQIYHEAASFEFWKNEHVMDLIRLIKKFEINLVLIDSASVSFGETLNDQAQVNSAIKNLYTIRSYLNVAMIVVAHTRKPPAGISSNPEDVSINDLFGHSGVAQSASSIWIFIEDEYSRKKAIKTGDKNKEDKILHAVNVKSRFGSTNAAFKMTLPSEDKIENGAPLRFHRNAIALPPLSEEQKRKAKKAAADVAVAEIFKDVNFNFDSDGD